MNKVKNNQNNYQWQGPWMLGQLIKETIKEDFPFPHGPIVYVVTEKKWDSQPAVVSKPLYVGMSGVTNVHQSRARLGALISNMLGFFKIKDNKRHRGGERKFEYCKNNRISPDKLYVAWCNSVNPNYEEHKMISSLSPSINKR